MNIIDDLKRVSAVVGTDLITRTQYREHGNFSDHAIKTEFGTFRAARRAAGLEEATGARLDRNALSRHVDHDAYRQMNIEKADYIDKFRKPKGTRFQTMLVASDIHDEECDPFWRRVFIDTVARVQPDTVVLGGDIFDLAEFGRYSVDPRDWDIVGKIKWVHDFLGDIREAAPDTELVFIAGNHEHRLLRYLTDNAPTLKVLLSDLHGWTVPKLLGLDKYEVRYVSRDDLGTFNKSNTMSEIGKNYEVFHESFMVDHFPTGAKRGVEGCNGHHHVYRADPYYSHVFGPYMWVQLGSGHRRAASYCDGERWDNGFLMVDVDTQEKRNVLSYMSIKDFASVAGKYYMRNENEL